MTTLWLIRHGASSAPAGLAIGTSDPPLSDAGRAQAARLAAELADRSLVRVLSSDRRRALETAAIVAAPHRLPVEVAAELGEIDFGAWEGRDLRDLWSEEPAAAAAWELDLRSTPATFGESADALERRVRRFWERLRGTITGEGEVAVVAHRGSLAVLHTLITGTPLAEAFATDLRPAAAIRVDA